MKGMQIGVNTFLRSKDSHSVLPKEVIRGTEASRPVLRRGFRVMDQRGASLTVATRFS